MGTRTVLFDDLDPKVEADETIRFALNGEEYEIDLAQENAKRFYDLFVVYVDKGRKIKQAKKPGRKPGVSNQTDGASAFLKDTLKLSEATSSQTKSNIRKTMRRWGQDYGWDLTPGERLPKELIDAYDQYIDDRRLQEKAAKTDL